MAIEINGKLLANENLQKIVKWIRTIWGFFWVDFFLWAKEMETKFRTNPRLTKSCVAGRIPGCLQNYFKPLTAVFLCPNWTSKLQKQEVCSAPTWTLPSENSLSGHIFRFCWKDWDVFFLGGEWVVGWWGLGVEKLGMNTMIFIWMSMAR